MSSSCGGIHPLHAVLLEEHHAALTHRRPGKRPVRASARRVAVSTQSRKAVPVPKVPQLAGVDLIHRLAVDDTVLAAPQPVSLLHHKVHIRHGTQHRHHGGLTVQRPAQRRHYQPIVAHRLQYVQPVHLRRPAPGQRHAVPGGEPSPDVGRADLGTHILHLQPRAAVIPPHHALRPAGVQPQIPRLRLTRRIRPHRIVPQCRAVPVAQGKRHLTAGLSCVLKTSPVGEIPRVDIHLVRPYQQIRAHVHQPLVPVCEHRLGLRPVDIQRRAVHPHQRLPAQKAVRLGQRCHHAAFGPHLQRRIAAAPQILHVPHTARAAAGPPIQSRELLHRQPLAALRLQLRKKHPSAPPNTAAVPSPAPPASPCGSSSPCT